MAVETVYPDGNQFYFFVDDVFLHLFQNRMTGELDKKLSDVHSSLLSAMTSSKSDTCYDAYGKVIVKRLEQLGENKAFQVFIKICDLLSNEEKDASESSES